jgi:methyltransferase (TIGR00027 family)
VQEGKPSATAYRVAQRRAAHQLLDRPLVFDDPLAVRIAGADDPAQRDGRAFDSARLSKALRAFFAARSRFAEDQLAAAVDQGLDQYVVLGAGLDTFAYRNPHQHLRVFEVDFPATQVWKQSLLATAQIAIPPSLIFVPVDFEKSSLPGALAGAGFDVSKPGWFSWLGVTMYLARETVMQTLALIAGLPPGSGVVFDYFVDPARLGTMERFIFERFAERVATAGEPWVTGFEPAALADDLRRLGLSTIEDLGQVEINSRYFSGRTDELQVGSLGRLVAASRSRG